MQPEMAAPQKGGSRWNPRVTIISRIQQWIWLPKLRKCQEKGLWKESKLNGKAKSWRTKEIEIKEEKSKARLVR